MDEKCAALTWRLPAALYVLLERNIERALAGFGLAANEYAILEVIWRNGGVCRDMRQLAESIVLSVSAVSRLVGQLDRARLVTRHLVECDRRSIYLELTERGRQVFLTARSAHQAAVRDALEDASAWPVLAELAETIKAGMDV